MDQLTELKHLLFEKEQESIERLQDRVERPVTRAQDVAEVLAESFKLNEQDNDQLVASMRSTVNQCINDSVRTDPSSFADALFPVIGPAIRKAVADSIAALAQRINQTLDNSLSARGVRWRIESWRTGVPLAEIILRDTLIYRVEEAFVIQGDTGLLIAHAAGEDIASNDSDAVSAMLTAIEDFARDSFRSDEQTPLDTIRVGGKTVWIFNGPHAMIAGVIRGNPPSELRETFHQVNEQVHAEFGEYLAAFDGESTNYDAIVELLMPLLASRSVQTNQEARTKPSMKPLAIAAAVFFALILAIMFFQIRESNKREQLVATLEAAPGIEVLGLTEDDGILRVRALRDPLAMIDADLALQHGMDLDELEFDYVPFYSLESEIVIRRARAFLKPPETVTTELVDDVLLISGRASDEWRAAAAQFPIGIAGVKQIDVSGLSLSDKATMELARSSLNVPQTVDLSIEGDRLVGHGVARYQWLQGVSSSEIVIVSIKSYDFSAVTATNASIVEYLQSATSSPTSVNLTLVDGELQVSGSAPQAWLERLHQVLPELPQATATNLSNFVETERLELESLIQRYANFELKFVRREEPTDDSRQRMRALAEDIPRMIAIDQTLRDVELEFIVTGHADMTGTPEQNQIVRSKRARLLSGLLLGHGIDSQRIVVIGEVVGSGALESMRKRSATLDIQIKSSGDSAL